MDGNDVGMVAESPHRLDLPGNTQTGGVIQFLSLDEGKGNIMVKEGIMDKVDLLLAALPQELLDLVMTPGKGGGNGRGRLRCGFG
jgi:hypothetical protein